MMAKMVMTANKRPIRSNLDHFHQSLLFGIRPFKIFFPSRKNYYQFKKISRGVFFIRK